MHVAIIEAGVWSGGGYNFLEHIVAYKVQNETRPPLC